MDQNILQLGAVAVIFLFAVREFFSYLKSRKDNGNSTANGNTEKIFEKIFMELKTMNSNHLHSIQEAIEQGNQNLVKTIHDDNMHMITLLGEIKGGLKSWQNQ